MQLHIYYHFHTKGHCSLCYDKIAFRLKRGVLLGLKVSDFDWKRGDFFRPKSDHNEILHMSRQLHCRDVC